MFKRFGWILLVMIPVGGFAGLVIAAVVTYVMPKKYESEAIIEVRPFANAPVEPPGRTEGVAPAWLLMEIEKMRSRPNLEKVSQNLGLPNRWYLADDQVPPILKDSLLIQSIRGTDLVSIRMRHTNKIDARDIAMEVAKVYQSYRKDIADQDSSRFLHELNKAVRDQEDKVEERRKVLATIVRTRGIIYKDQSKEENESEAKNSLQEFHKTEQEVMQLESQIGSLLKYDSDQLLVYAAGLDLPDNIIRNLLPVYQQAKRDLEGLKINGLDGRHPTVVAKVDQIGKMKGQLDECVVNLRATLEAKLDFARDHLKQAEARKESANQANNRATDYPSYADAKREFESDQELLQKMKLKLISEELSSKNPRDSVVVHDSPVISESPVSPNVTLNLVLGTVLGAILFPLMTLPVIWILSRRRTEVAA